MRAIDTRRSGPSHDTGRHAPGGFGGPVCQERAWVPVLALAEASWGLATVYELPAARIATAVGMLLNHAELALQDADVVTAELERFLSRPSLGLSDCLMLELARKAGRLPLWTFDRALARLDGIQKP